MSRFTLVLAVLLALAGRAATAQEIMAIAASPDGSTLQVAGDNRVLYTLDAASLEVTNRRYMPEQIAWMRYSSDGRILYVLNEDKSFAAYDSGKFKKRFGVEDIISASYAPQAGRIALLEGGYREGTLHVVDAVSGEPVTTLEIADQKVSEVVLTADGSKALILTQSEQSETEEKAQAGSELKGFDKFVFQQQHDGQISRLISADLATGTLDVADTWYKVYNVTQGRMLDGAAAFTKTTSDSALVAPDGSTTLLNLGDDYAGYVRISDDGRSVVLINGRKVRLHPLQDGVAGDMALLVEADRLAGPAEWVKAMDEGADGTLYFGTSGYRIWKLAPGATAFVAAPVF